MSNIRFAKVVSSLPAVLEPDTLYLVRVGAGFDLYVSDATGSVAYPVNAFSRMPLVRRTEAPRAAGLMTGTSSSTTSLIGGRQYFVPFSVPEPVQLTGLGMYVSTAAAGTVELGIYDNTVTSEGDAPSTLLAATAPLDTSTTGVKTGAISLALAPGRIYWASLKASSTPTVRTLAVSSAMAIGVIPEGSGVVTYLFMAGSGSSLPSSVSGPISVGTAGAPVIYLLE